MVLMNTAKAIGAETLRTIQVSATGSHSVSIGKNRNPDVPWPVGRVKAYTLQMDFDAGQSHVQLREFRMEQTPFLLFKRHSMLRAGHRQSRDNSRKPHCFLQNFALRCVRFPSMRTRARAQAEPTHWLSRRPCVRVSSRLIQIHPPRRRTRRRLGAQPRVRMRSITSMIFNLR